jgi:hypothetical protein
MVAVGLMLAAAQAIGSGGNPSRITAPRWPSASVSGISKANDSTSSRSL